MTLIAVYKSSGDSGSRCVGRCDANCYEAVSPDCDCICGGRNHGAGLKKATDNTREMYAPWIEEYERRNQLMGVQWEVLATNPKQPSLF